MQCFLSPLFFFIFFIFLSRHITNYRKDPRGTFWTEKYSISHLKTITSSWCFSTFVHTIHHEKGERWALLTTPREEWVKKKLIWKWCSLWLVPVESENLCMYHLISSKDSSKHCFWVQDNNLPFVFLFHVTN